jgi:hypothetical protein
MEPWAVQAGQQEYCSHAVTWVAAPLLLRSETAARRTIRDGHLIE